MDARRRQSRPTAIDPTQRNEGAAGLCVKGTRGSGTLGLLTLVGCLFFAASTLYLLAVVKSHGTKLDKLQQNLQEATDRATQFETKSDAHFQGMNDNLTRFQVKTDAELAQLTRNWQDELRSKLRKELAEVDRGVEKMRDAMTNKS